MDFSMETTLNTDSIVLLLIGLALVAAFIIALSRATK